MVYTLSDKEKKSTLESINYQCFVDLTIIRFFNTLWSLIRQERKFTLKLFRIKEIFLIIRMTLEVENVQLEIKIFQITFKLIKLVSLYYMLEKTFLKQFINDCFF